MGPAGSQWMKSLQIYIDLPTVPVFCSNPFDSLGTDYEFWPHMMSEHLSRHQILTQNVAGEKNLRKKKKKKQSFHSSSIFCKIMVARCHRGMFPRKNSKIITASLCVPKCSKAMDHADPAKKCCIFLDRDKGISSLVSRNHSAP